MSRGFVKLFREKGLELLEADPKAFLLLSLIALRARRTDAPYADLRANQAFVGDHEKIGLSRQEYRSAQKRLVKYQLASFVATSRGTIATLASTENFDINARSSSSEQPSHFSRQISTCEPTKSHQETHEEPITRKEESKKCIMKEDLLHPKPPQMCKQPRDITHWKKMMISQGWIEEEFNAAWDKYLQEPKGRVKNVRKWLEAVMQSIRDSQVKDRHLSELTQAEAGQRAAEAKTVYLQKEEDAQQLAKTVLANRAFMQKVDEVGVSKEKYQIGDDYVKLIGGDWNGYCYGYSEADFMQVVSKHLNLNNNQEN